MAAATERLATLERLAAQAADLGAAAEQVDLARKEVAAHPDGSALMWTRRNEASETWPARWRLRSKR